MKSLSVKLFALFAYASFLLCAGMLFRFLAVAPPPDAASSLPAWLAALANAGLLSLFALPHSLMARASFKTAVARWLPREAERSLYVLVAALTLMTMMWLWQPLPARVWSVEAEGLRHALWAMYGLGWLILVAATFQLDHWGLFGLRQAFARQGEGAHATPALRTPWMYRRVRHPIMTGVLLLSWATPVMTVGHLLLASLFTLYILIGTRHEERDLRDELGDAYADYAQRVPAFIPWPRVERWGGLRRGAAIALLGALLAGAWWLDADWRAAPTLPGRYEHVAFEHGGHTRSALVYLPSRPDPRAAPILALHGSQGDGPTMQRMTAFRFDEIAEQRGALLIYPDGHEGHWNDCRRAADYPARRLGIDDVGFLDALAGALASQYGITAPRVFVAGYSNGAHLAFRWATQAPERLAGVIAIAASLPTADNMDCVGSPADVPLFLVNGTRDPISPFEGGVVSLWGFRPRGEVLSSLQTLRAFGLRVGDPTHAPGGQPRWLVTPRGLSAYLFLPGAGHTFPDSEHRFPRFFGATAAQRIDGDLLRFIEHNHATALSAARPTADSDMALKH